MDIVHRISLDVSPQDRLFLQSIEIEAPDRGFFTFEIRESATHWERTKGWVNERKPVDLVWTTFDSSEVLAAKWCALAGEWSYGYPEPRAAYPAKFFDLPSYCRLCGLGAVQDGAIRMKGEPPWGGRSIMQFHWLHDEFFVTPRLYDEVFRPRSIESRFVLPIRGDDALRTVRQLVFSDDGDLDTGPLEGATCVRCERIKYRPHLRGRLPPLRRVGTNCVFRTTQFFGTGAEAYRMVIASQDIVRSLVDSNVRGIGFKPLVDGS